MAEGSEQSSTEAVPTGRTGPAEPAGPTGPRDRGGPLGWLGRTFESLRDANFRQLYFGNIMQFGSMQMQLVVRGWLVFHLTGSFAALGTMALANAIPGLLFSPVGGVVADRAPKKTVIQMAQFYNVMNAAALALLAGGFLGFHLAFWHLFLSAFLQGGVNSIMMPSRQSIISDLVGPERLMNAIGINASGQTLMQLLGPGVAGFMIATLSPASVFWAMALMYLLAMSFTMRLPKYPLYSFANTAAGAAARAGRRARRGSTWHDLSDGMKYVARDPTIRLLIVVNFLIVVVAMPYTMLMPGFVRTVLCVEPTCSASHSGFIQGTLQSVQGIGALVGAVVVASAASKGRGRMMIIWGALLGVGLVAFSISRNYWITMAIMTVIGAAQAGRMAIGQVLIQTYSQEEYRGRVMAVWFMQFSLVQFGTFVVSILAEFFGPQWAIGGLAAVLVVAMGLCAAFMPRIRNLD